MFFIRHSRLFSRKETEEPRLVCHKRSEGRLKRYESCTDTRAWSLDKQARASYVLDFMSSIARTGDYEVSRSGYEKEYTSEAIEHAGALHGKSAGVPLQSRNLPLKSEEGILDDFSLQHGFYSQETIAGDETVALGDIEETIATAQQPNSVNSCGCGPKKESVKETIGGEETTLALDGIEETIAFGAISQSESFEETIGGEETVALGDIEETIATAQQPNSVNSCGCGPKKESFKENIPDEYSVSSLDGPKFIRTAALGPNPNRKPKPKQQLEWTVDGEDTFEESIPDEYSISSSDGRKFIRTAALGPNPNRKPKPKNQLEWTVEGEDTILDLDDIKQEGLQPNSCGCGPKKELLHFPIENNFLDKHNGFPLQAADIKVEKKSDEAIQSENQHEQTVDGQGTALALDDIKKESSEKSIPDKYFASSVHGGKFPHVAPLKPNPAHSCVCSAAKELLTSSKEKPFFTVSLKSAKVEKKYDEMPTSSKGNALYTVSLQPAYIKVEKKSDESIQSENQPEETIGQKETTLDLDNIKQESFEESIPDEYSISSLDGRKFIRTAALRPNPVRKPKPKTHLEWTVDGEDTTLDLDNIKQESFEESIPDEYSISSSDGRKFIRTAALRPNPNRKPKPKTQLEWTVGREDTTVALDDNEQESFDENIPEEYSVSSDGKKFIRTAAQQPNSVNSCGCGPKKELLHFSKEKKILDKHSGVPLQHVDIKAEKKSDVVTHSDNQLEETDRREDGSHPLDRIKLDTFAEGFVDDIIRSSLYGEKFTQIAALTSSAMEEIGYHNFVHGVDITSSKHSVRNEENSATEESPSVEYISISSLPIPDIITIEDESEISMQGKKLQSNFNSEQMDPPVGACSCNTKKQPSHVLKTDKSPTNVSTPEAKFIAGTVRDTKGYDVVKEEKQVHPALKEEAELPGSGMTYFLIQAPQVQGTHGEATGSDGGNMDDVMNSREYGKEDGQFETESRFNRQRIHACREAKEVGSSSQEEVGLPGIGMTYFLIPAPQVQGSELNIPETSVYESIHIPHGAVAGKDGGFETESSSNKQHMCACREVKEVGSASQEEAELPACGKVYFLMPIPQAQGTESETESSSNKQRMYACREAPVTDVTYSDGHLESLSTEENIERVGSEKLVRSLETGRKRYKKQMDIVITELSDRIRETEALRAKALATKSETDNSFNTCACSEEKGVGCATQEETELSAYERVIKSLEKERKFYKKQMDTVIRELNDQIKEAEALRAEAQGTEFKTESSYNKQHMCACRHEKEVGCVTQEETELPTSEEVEGKCCGGKETAVKDATHSVDHLESLGTEGNIHREESEKLVRSLEIQSKFYKEQMDIAIRKLNDRMKETETLRAERDLLKTDLDAAQNYIEQHKQALNKLKSMRKVDEQLSQENELLLKKVYQLSHTACNQQTTISKLKTKLKQKSKHGSFIQNNSSNGKSTAEFKPVHILFPNSQNNLMVPRKSYLLESYSQHPINNSLSDYTSRYNNTSRNSSYSFNHVNGKSAFVEQTINHVQITEISDNNPQNKRYLDLKKTIRREKDDLMKVTKLIQFQQGIITNLSNCLDHEKMLLSELNSRRKYKK